MSTQQQGAPWLHSWLAASLPLLAGLGLTALCFPDEAGVALFFADFRAGHPGLTLAMGLLTIKLR